MTINELVVNLILIIVLCICFLWGLVDTLWDMYNVVHSKEQFDLH